MLNKINIFISNCPLTTILQPVSDSAKRPKSNVSLWGIAKADIYAGLDGAGEEMNEGRSGEASFR